MKFILFVLLTLFMKTDVFSQSVFFSKGFKVDLHLEYLSYNRINQSNINRVVLDRNIWVKNNSYGISYANEDDNQHTPLAFIDNIGGQELYLGQPNSYYSRLLEELHPLASKCESLDLRNSRLIHAFYDLASIFPSLNNLFLSSNTLGDTALKQLILPNQLKTLILEGYNIHQDFFDFLKDNNSIKTLILVNCWSDQIYLPPHMVADKEFYRSSFSGISKHLEYLVLIKSSEMLYLDILHAEFPKLEGMHIDVSFDFLYGAHHWLRSLQNSNNVKFPNLQSIYISMNYLDDDNFARFKKSNEEQVAGQQWIEEKHEDTNKRLIEWILGTVIND